MPGAGEAPPLLRGTKRKASYMGDIEPSQSASATYPPMQPKPGSPNRLEFKESSMTASGPPENQVYSSANRLGDVNYNIIPDYAPPTSTLPIDNPHILQVHWPRKVIVDLSNDPDRHMLHEAELQLVTSLNLSCAKYLCTKRRLFQARLKALQEDREFRWNDCQKACKIDANKVSKIFGAFEKVGWLDKKYFLRYLDENNKPSSNSNDESKDMGSSSSEISKPDIWEVSESEYYVTSEEDEESVDGDTADSSVSFDGRYEESQDRKSLDSYQDFSLSKQCFGPSRTGRDESQEKVHNKKYQISNTLSRTKTVDEGPKTEDRRRSPKVVLKEKVDNGKPASLSADDTDDFPVLETRSMTQKMKLAQISRVENQCDSSSTIEAQNSQQKSDLDKPCRGGTPTNEVAKRIPIPHSLDEANAADIMLVKMKKECRPWLEIEKAIEKQTGKAQVTTSLTRRYSRIMRNLARTRAKTNERHGKVRTLPRPLLEPDNGQLLLAAEAEIESKFQEEKANILAEIERKYQSEKWGLVAETMSRAVVATYSADLVQAQYERLTARPKKAIAKDKIDRDTFTDLPRQTPCAVGRETLEIPTTARSGTGRVDEASTAIDISADGAERNNQTVSKPGPRNHAEHSARMRKVWAKRRALGRDGLYGGQPEASTIARRAKLAALTTAPGAEISPAPAISQPSDHAQDPSSKPKQPIVLKEKVIRDANPHKHSLAQIIPAAAPADSGPKHNEPPTKHGGAKRPHTCRKCGMTNVSRSEHYRMYPNVGSEHRRRMAANNRMAAETPLAS